ncbi:1-deoxy-D-xylulose-5-phosphate synthase [Planctomycetota bacterium]
MGEWLDKTETPENLKQLSISELKVLAGEIREFLLASISKTGGHLASNLGVVELTLALHYVFDFERDRLLWDVGHQCYTHKIITGRRAGFERLRKAGGVSGFPNPRESVHDHFSVGHAGTAIPTAIGVALAEQVKQQGHPDPATTEAPKVVALVGDASIVNGTSFEGLNNLGLVNRQLLVVLNDNSMAIDATVGALAKYFARVRLSHTYDDIRKTTRSILEHVPKFGRSMDGAVERLKKHIRMVLPGSQLFESLNIPYFGPVDGHDLESLIQLFLALKELDHPVLLHAYTKKGKGFTPARSGPSRFHSTGPFVYNGDEVEPVGKPGRPSFTEVFGRQLVALADQDKRLVAITSAMCEGTGLVSFREQFPDRFFDVGIAESAAVDIAAGFAHGGLKPVVCIYSTFLQRSFDQIFQEVALQNLPVIFCVDRAGFVGADGPTHHGVMDIGTLRMMPNMVLCAPANDVEMKQALTFAVSHDGPVVIRYPRDMVPEIAYVPTGSAQAFVQGKGVWMNEKQGAEVVVVSYGNTLTEALKAADALAREGVDVGVFNARFAAPIDDALVTLVREGKKLITVEDHRLACGFGSALLERAATCAGGTTAAGSIRVLGTPRVFIGHDTRVQQLMKARINADEIIRTAKELHAAILYEA